MNYSQLIKQTWILIAFSISCLVFLLFTLFLFIEIVHIQPVFYQLAPELFLLSFLVILTGLTTGQIRYNRRIQILKAIETPALRVILYRKAVFYRLILWEISGAVLAFFYGVTGTPLILLLALCLIPLCASSFVDIYLAQSRLNLTDYDIKTMVFHKWRRENVAE